MICMIKLLLVVLGIILKYTTYIKRVRISDVEDPQGNPSVSRFTTRDYVSGMIRPRDMVRAQPMGLVHAFVRSGGGQHLRTISITEASNHQRYAPQIIQDFANNCPNVTSMHITSGGADWLRCFGHQLTAVSLGYYAPLHVLRDRCTAVKELTLYGDAVYGNQICWRRLGMTLEVISASFSRRRNRWDIREIGQYCRKLRRIQLDVIKDDIEELSAILPTYKQQLEYAVISGMTEAQIVTVVESCPNAKFGLTVFSYKHLLSSLKVIGQRLEVIHINAGNSVQPSELSTAWNNCGAVKHLQYSAPDLRHIHNLFTKPKPCLKSLVIDFPDDPYIQNTLDMIATQTGYLEKIVLNWKTTNPPVSYRSMNKVNGVKGTDLFRKLAKSNAPSLSKVIIALHSSPESLVPVDAAKQIFCTFSKLPHIEQLVLYGFDEREFLDHDNPVEEARKIAIDVETGYYPELINDTKTMDLRWMLRN